MGRRLGLRGKKQSQFAGSWPEAVSDLLEIVSLAVVLGCLSGLCGEIDWRMQNEPNFQMGRSAVTVTTERSYDKQSRFMG